MKTFNDLISNYNNELDKITILQKQDILDRMHSGDTKTKIGLSRFPVKYFQYFLMFIILIATFYILANYQTIFNISKSVNNSTNTDKNEPINQSDDMKYFNITNIQFLELTQQELEKIGIMKNDTAYIVQAERSVDLESQTPESIFSEANRPESNQIPKLEKEKHFKIWKQKRIDTYKKYGYPYKGPFLFRESAILKLPEFHSIPNKYENWKNDDYSQISPVSITSWHYKGQFAFCMMGEFFGSGLIKETNSMDELQNIVFEYSSPIDIKKLPGISQLIPIKIKMGNPNIKINYRQKTKKGMNGKQLTYEEYRAMKETYAEYIIWYLPTSEFVNKLPERYAKRIRKELKIIEKVNKGELARNEMCKELEGEKSILGLCDNSSDYIFNANVYPNPVNDNAILKFSAKSESHFSANIYELTGRKLKTIFENKFLKAGNHEEPFNLAEFQSGVYIIILSSSNNEQIILRILKN